MLYFSIQNACGKREKNLLTGSWSDHACIMVGSCSDRLHIVDNVSSVFGKFI